MTQRAVAPLPIDMQRVLTAPLGGRLHLTESVEASGQIDPDSGSSCTSSWSTTPTSAANEVVVALAARARPGLRPPGPARCRAPPSRAARPTTRSPGAGRRPGSTSARSRRAPRSPRPTRSWRAIGGSRQRRAGFQTSFSSREIISPVRANAPEPLGLEELAGQIAQDRRRRRGRPAVLRRPAGRSRCRPVRRPAARRRAAVRLRRRLPAAARRHRPRGRRDRPGGCADQRGGGAGTGRRRGGHGHARGSRAPPHRSAQGQRRGRPPAGPARCSSAGRASTSRTSSTRRTPSSSTRRCSSRTVSRRCSPSRPPGGAPATCPSARSTSRSPGTGSTPIPARRWCRPSGIADDVTAIAPEQDYLIDNISNTLARRPRGRRPGQADVRLPRGSRRHAGGDPRPDTPVPCSPARNDGSRPSCASGAPTAATWSGCSPCAASCSPRPGAVIGLAVGFLSALAVLGGDALLRASTPSLILSGLIGAGGGFLAAGSALYGAGRASIRREINEDRARCSPARRRGGALPAGPAGSSSPSPSSRCWPSGPTPSPASRVRCTRAAAWT